MVSVVSTPKMTGRPVSRPTWRIPVRRRAGDEVEVTGLALDHRAKADDRIRRSGRTQQRARRERQFEGSRDADEDDVVGPDAQPGELGAGRLDEPVDDLRVEAGGDDPDPQPAPVGVVLHGPVAGSHGLRAAAHRLVSMRWPRRTRFVAR